MQELISVVVPIYNVEKYLEKCINSIINQTYTNIEIILVDDGATDSSCKICDDFVKKDSRIKVIHKKNGGLSDARNEGKKNSTADYILFIDSDDWIDSSMIEILYRNLKQNGCDISICDFVEEDDNGNIVKVKPVSNQVYIYDSTEALAELVTQEKITNHAWNKLYKKSLFDDVEYPKGKLMEDIYTTYKLFEKSKKIIYDSSILYHYIQRKTSILGNISKKRIVDQEDAIFSRNEYLLSQYPQFSEIIHIDNCINVKSLYYLAIIGNFKDIYKSNQYIMYYKQYKKIYKKYKRNNILKKNKSVKLFYFNKIIYMSYIKLKKVIGEIIR